MKDKIFKVIYTLAMLFGFVVIVVDTVEENRQYAAEQAAKITRLAAAAQAGVASIQLRK